MVKVIKSIFNRIKHKSLTQQLFFIKFGLMLIAAVLVSLPTFIIFRNIVANQIALARVDVLKQIGERTRVVKNSLAFLSNLYYYDEEVVGYINGKEIDYQTNLIINRKLSDRDSKYSTAFNKINFSYYIVLYGENGTRYVSTQSTDYDFDILTSNLWYRDVLENKGNIHWVSSFKDYSDRTNPRYVFSAARIFLGPENQNVAGLLLVNTDERLLYETYKNALSGKNRIYIVDERGNIVSNDDGGMLGLNYYNMDRLEEIFGSKNYAIVDKSGKSVLLSRYKDYESGWMIIEEVLTEDIFGELYRATFMIAMILGLFIIFSATFSYLLAKNITAPLKAICNYMKEVENGDIDVISDIQGWKEIQDISNRFNRMLREIKKLLLNVKDEERRKHKAQLDFLQAQINPHFMHNTLFSIKCLVAMGRSKDAEKMISDFMDLLSHIFNNKDEYISINEELKCIKKYVDLQSYRYSNKISLLIDCDDSLLDCFIPKLILQPVVENAIFHGIEPKQEGGCISIFIKEENEDVIISIKDDGIGMDEETIDNIKRGKKDLLNKSFNMVGLANIEQRIILNYGSEYGMEIESEIGMGTSIILRFPITKVPVDLGG